MARKPDKRTNWHPSDDEGAVQKAAEDLIEKTTRRPRRADGLPKKDDPNKRKAQGDALRDETDTFEQLEQLTGSERDG